MEFISRNREGIQLFLTGFVQVLLVAVNTYQIAHAKYVGAVAVSFLISLVWTFNVKSVAFGTNGDRFVYAGGAAFGTLIGLTSMTLIY